MSSIFGEDLGFQEFEEEVEGCGRYGGEDFIGFVHGCGGLGVRSQESGVRSQESGVRSQESGVRSQESGVRSQESG